MKIYEGPYIDKKFDWKCPDRKRHNVILFGSWDGFKGSDELQYEGRQIFSITVKLPIGSYVYRFLIDGEEWETNNTVTKTVRDGIEYNTIHVREDGDSSTDDDNEEDESKEKVIINDIYILSNTQNKQICFGFIKNNKQKIIGKNEPNESNKKSLQHEYEIYQLLHNK